MIIFNDLAVARNSKTFFFFFLKSFSPRFQHPLYVQNLHPTNDIALIKMERKVKLSWSIHPACLPVPDQPESTDYFNCWITGWGETYGKYRRVRYTYLPLITIYWLTCVYMLYNTIILYCILEEKTIDFSLITDIDRISLRVIFSISQMRDCC